MEKLKINEQKEIIQDIVNRLAVEDPSFYYTESSVIASLVHEKIHKEKVLSKQKTDLVKGLSAEDIKILLSYRSNCC